MLGNIGAKLRDAPSCQCRHLHVSKHSMKQFINIGTDQNPIISEDLGQIAAVL